MDKKKGNTTLIVIAAILIILVIILVIIDASLGDKPNKTTSNTSVTNNSTSKENTSTISTDSSSNTSSTSTVTTDETTEKTDEKKEEKIADDESAPEEVKKIDEAQGKIYEKEISLGTRTTKVPVINLTTKAVTRINSEIETKYKDGSSSGYYIVYYYYMYVGMISIILDYRYTNGSHKYEVYNVNFETGKQMSNEDLLAKLKVSKEDFLNKAKSAYKAKFEEVFKDVDKNSSPYKKALEATLKNAESALEDPMFINLEAQFALYAKIINVASNSEEFYLVEFN